MAAELAVRAQRPFQIHQRTGFGKLQVGAPPRFLEQIELRELEFPARGNFYRRQTTAIHRQAAAGFQAATGHAGAHGQFNGFRRRLDALDGSRFFNNACEHKVGQANACPRFLLNRLVKFQRRTKVEPATDFWNADAGTASSSSKSGPSRCHSTSRRRITSARLGRLRRPRLCANRARPEFSARRKTRRAGPIRRAETTRSPRRRLRPAGW